MQKKYTLLLAILLVNTTAIFANNKIDSIGIENNKGKKTIIYKVEAKETYYSISKKYNANYKDVMEFNDNQLLQIGVTLKIPTQIPFLGTNTTTPINSTIKTTEYTIKAKDNLNMLAAKYGTTVDEIKRINNLSSINLQIGQVLQIPTSGSIIEENVNNPVNSYTPPVKPAVINTPVTTYSPPVKTPSVITESITSHTIKAKENLNLIAKMYDTSVEDIKSLNGLSSNNLQIGQVLKIPSTNPSVETIALTKEVVAVAVETKVEKVKEKVEVQKPVVTPPVVKAVDLVNDGNITHVVTASETIYAIAKKYNTTTYQIQTANNLKSSDLKVGQKLTIKNMVPISVNAAQDTGSDEPIESITTPTLRGSASKYGITQKEERGVAVWIEDQDLDPTKMLILHRTAPVGTVIKITNPMTSRSTFGKVVGKFTENETTKDVIIVMTKAVADAIGALDKRFACTLSYGAIDNEQ